MYVECWSKSGWFPRLPRAEKIFPFLTRECFDRSENSITYIKITCGMKAIYMGWSKWMQTSSPRSIPGLVRELPILQRGFLLLNLFLNPIFRNLANQHFFRIRVLIDWVTLQFPSTMCPAIWCNYSTSLLKFPANQLEFATFMDKSIVCLHIFFPLRTKVKYWLIRLISLSYQWAFFLPPWHTSTSLILLPLSCLALNALYP